MGLLEDILARGQYTPSADGFPTIPAPFSNADDAALTEALRQRERTRFAMPSKQPDILAPAPSAVTPPALNVGGIAPQDPSLNSQSAAVQLAMDQAPAGTGVPFSTQAGMLAAPVTLPTAAPDPAPSPSESVPLPMPRPAAAPGSTDISARQQPPAPTNLVPPTTVPQPAAPPTAEPPPSMFGRLGGTLMNGLSNNSNALLAIGAGFAGAPNIGQAISRASSAVIPAHAADVKQQLDLQSRSYGTKALVDAGVPLQQAIAAAGDPDLKKALIQNYIIDRKSEIKSVKSKDAFGNETEKLYSINPFDNTVKEITPGTDGKGGAAEGGKNASFAQGITPETFDHSKVGDEYLAQFSPELQAGVKAYLRGDSLPTGRQQQAQVIKQIAQKYGDDVGTPANDQAYYQRKTFTTSLGDTKSGIGMQTKGFQQGLEHVANLSDKLVAMKNWNGMGIEPIANWENWVRGLSTTQRGIINGAVSDAHVASGEIGKLFSGNSGGGVKEREESAKRLGDPNMSGPAAAGALEATLEQMHGGLTPLEQRRDELFPGSEKPKGSNFRGPAQEAAMARVRKNIAILRGEASPSAVATPAPASMPAASGKTSTGVPWSVN